MQDVKPPIRRSIRDIPVMGGASRRRKKIIKEDPIDMEPVSKPSAPVPPQPIAPSEHKTSPSNFVSSFSRGSGEPPRPPSSLNNPYPTFKSKKKFSSKALWGVIAIVVVVVFVVGMMTVFSSARVDITPKQDTIAVDITTTASRISAEGGDLPYEVIEIVQEDGIEAEAIGEEVVEYKASGRITVYNNYSSESQRLITRTRFESPEGLIYRIAESVVVPGKSSNGTPGSIVVEVFADEPGEEYNISATDFTIPGFKDDSSRYEGFYAESVTPMTGGFVGQVKRVSDEDKQRVEEELENNLKASLEKAIVTQVPNGSVFISGGAIYNFTELPQEEASAATAMIRRQGTIRAVVFDERRLEEFLTLNFLSGWEGITPDILDWNNMSVVLQDGADLDGDIQVSFSGNAEVYAYINELEIAEALGGKSKKELQEVMAPLPGIESAKATIRPVWMSSFPEDTAKINVNIGY